jgi:hypothetical protein
LTHPHRIGTPMTSKELIALAERCEAAAGPDRELDMLIWAALNGFTDVHDTESKRVEATDAEGVVVRLMGWIDPGEHSRNFTAYGGDPAYPFYTASIDAAMTLAIEGVSAPDVLRHAIERCLRYGRPTLVEAFPRFVTAEWLRALAHKDESK